MGKDAYKPERQRLCRHDNRRDAMCGIRSPGLRRGLVWEKTHTSPERQRLCRHDNRRDAMCGIRSPGLRRGLVWRDGPRE
jgi:hypothetical protein